VDATPWRKVSRCPYAVARERGGNFRATMGVKRAIPWIYPRERARRKVRDRENQSCDGGRLRIERQAERRERREQC
jgi:hypothetical protein